LSEIWIGIRPEHLGVQNPSDAMTENPIEGFVEVVEPQGSTALIQVRVTEDIRLRALVGGQSEARVGDRLVLSVSSQEIYAFDPATEQSLN
jgi:multiple sugar transport system ATP-binding protein